MKLPPYGRQYVANPPPAGLHVAIGPGAWNFARSRPYATLVLPTENAPGDFRWPSHRDGAVVHERGEFDDDRLEAMAAELIQTGCPFVVGIREALLDHDPRVFFYREVDRDEA